MARSWYKLQNFDLCPLSVTLTFDRESWIMYVSCLHTIVNNSTKYHEDTKITCKDMAMTRYKIQNTDF